MWCFETAAGVQSRHQKVIKAQGARIYLSYSLLCVMLYCLYCSFRWTQWPSDWQMSLDEIKFSEAAEKLQEKRRTSTNQPLVLMKPLLLENWNCLKTLLMRQKSHLCVTYCPHKRLTSSSLQCGDSPNQNKVSVCEERPEETVLSTLNQAWNTAGGRSERVRASSRGAEV